jgi:hypothetical protein
LNPSRELLLANCFYQGARVAPAAAFFLF